MSFNILYHEGGDVQLNLSSLAIYLDSCAKGMGITELNVDPAKLTSVAKALMRKDFPHVDGWEKASPFKKAANFFVWFVAEKPILDPLPEYIAGPKLVSIPNHQNVVMAYRMSTLCLFNAKLFKQDDEGNRSETILARRIRVSTHFLCDFVEAYGSTTQDDFQKVSLLFEQMAYKANDNAPYKEVI